MAQRLIEQQLQHQQQQQQEQEQGAEQTQRLEQDRRQQLAHVVFGDLVRNQCLKHQ